MSTEPLEGAPLPPDFTDNPPIDGQTQRIYNLGIDGVWDLATFKPSHSPEHISRTWSGHPVYGDAVHVEWSEKNGVWVKVFERTYQG